MHIKAEEIGKIIEVLIRNDGLRVGVCESGNVL